ncbi:MAG: hypothetical protein ABIP30_13400 [Ferruginibacter sp.]
MKTNLYLIAPSLLLILITSCTKTRECELPLNISQSSIQTIFKDGITGKYLYAESNPLYNKDSLKIFDQNNNELFLLYSTNLIPGTSSAYYEINFGPLYIETSDENSFNSEICKSFYVQYNSKEKDTIITCFKSKKTKCGSVFETLKVYNKQQLLSNEINTTTSIITITKK